MHKICLAGRSQRDYALQCVNEAPPGAVVSIVKSTRTNQQNAKMWAMLNDVSKSAPDGRQWQPETWKSAFMHHLGHEVKFEQSLEGNEPFPIGFRTSRLSVEQMADLITAICEYGDRHGVEWRETVQSGFEPAAKNSK